MEKGKGFPVFAKDIAVRAFLDLDLLAMHSIARARPMPDPDQVLLKCNIFPRSERDQIMPDFWGRGREKGEVAQEETVLLKVLGLGERMGRPILEAGWLLLIGLVSDLYESTKWMVCWRQSGNNNELKIE